MKISINKNLLVVVAFALTLQSGSQTIAVGYSAIPAVDCVINPYRVADIASPVTGIIEEIFVERSDIIKAGQVVAKLDASVERANVELAKYRAGIESEIRLGKVNIEYDKLRKKRYDTLYKRKNTSRDDADQVEREYQLSRWKLKQAIELADVRKLELQRAEQQLSQKSIKAPFDGYVLDTIKQKGEYVEEQAIMRVAQLDPLVIEAIMPMENFGVVKAGMQAEIVPDVLFKEKLMAEVSVVDRIGDTASNTFGVKLTLPNPDNRIPAGLKCVVKFLEQDGGNEAGHKEMQGQGDTISTEPVKSAATVLSEQDRQAGLSQHAVANSAPIFDAAQVQSVAEVQTLAAIRYGDR
jgi:RND family efflux transporter MFP subunit